MAGRNFAEFINTLERGVVEIYTQVLFGGVGAAAPTLQAWKPPQLNTNGSFITAPTGGTTGTSGYGGVGTVTGGTGATPTAPGLFTFTFQSNTTFSRLLGVSLVFDTTTAAAIPLAPGYYIKSQSVNPTTQGTLATIVIGTLNGSLAATDPASGEIGLFRFKFSNSSVGAN